MFGRYVIYPGSIPKELGALGDLEVLKLGSNRLTGKVPSETIDTKSKRRRRVREGVCLQKVK